MNTSDSLILVKKEYRGMYDIYSVEDNNNSSRYDSLLVA